MEGTDEKTRESSGSRRQPEGMGKYSMGAGRQKEATGITAREILSPEERMELAILSLAEGSKAVAAGIGRRIVNNPLPVALAGVGISWLLLMGRDGSPASFGSLATNRLRGRYRRKERLDTAAGLIRERSTEMGARLAMLAREKPFSLAAFAFSTGAVLGALVSAEQGDGRLRGKGRQEYYAVTGEAAALTAHSEIRSQAGGFGPEETEPEMEKTAE